MRLNPMKGMRTGIASLNHTAQQWVQRTAQLHPRLSTVMAVVGTLYFWGAIGAVGYLSYRTSTDAIEALADRVLEQVSDRVVEHLARYTETPKTVTQINEHEIKERKLDSNNLLSWSEHLIQQGKLFNSLSYIYFGAKDGKYIEIQRFGQDRLKYGDGQPPPPLKVSVYPLSEEGDRGQLNERRTYDPRLRPWYQTAQREKKPTWTSVYAFTDSFTEKTSALGMSFVRPVYDKKGKLEGVLGADYALVQTQEFLQNLHLLKSGKVFILERNGNLIATSTEAQPFQPNLDRISGEDYPEPIIKTTAQYLRNHLQGQYNLTEPKRLTFQWQNRSQQVRVVPFSDGMGLNWLVVVVIPESDFMGEIESNRRNILIICGIAMIITILSSILTSHWLMRSISALIKSSQKIGSGNLTDPVPMLKRSSWEVMTLSRSLEEMRYDLKNARDRLQNYTTDLEQEVQHRTADLTERNLELAKTLQDFQTSQDHLIRSEKLASLGKLVASIAHEMNTPLGVIRSSTHNISTFLRDDLEQFVRILQTFDPEYYPQLLGFLNKMLHPDNSVPPMTSAERRQARQTVSQFLSDHNVSQPDQMASMLVDLGIGGPGYDWERLRTALNYEDCDRDGVVSALYHVSTSQQSLQAIEAATDAAESVIQALRLYESQETQGEFIAVNLVESLELTLKLYENLLRRGVTVDRRYGEIPSVWGSPQELNQVWSNLIHNALQSMNCQGSLQIDLSLQGAEVVVAISNDGPPIAPDVIPHLFEPFFTTRPPGEGKGMGLTIVQRIVEKHYGQVVLTEADLPFTTRFVVTVPTDFRDRGVVL
jgi:C4-dicarboxylate-specific signal transduction histidine kinase